MWIMGRDQYGQTYHDLGKAPRKELARRLGYSPKSARKMYEDKRDGTTKHVGYVFGSLWVRLYTVSPLERTVS